MVYMCMCCTGPAKDIIMYMYVCGLHAATKILNDVQMVAHTLGLFFYHFYINTCMTCYILGIWLSFAGGNAYTRQGGQTELCSTEAVSNYSQSFDLHVHRLP